MTPVRRRDLVVLAGGLAVATWLLVRSFYGEMPALDWWLPLPLGLLAVGEALGARTLRSRLADLRAARSAPGNRPDERPAPAQVRPVEPMLVARLAVLAQASAYVGAVFTGIWAGVLAHVGPAIGRLQAATGDSVSALVGVACAAGLVVAALWLESVCRVPPEDHDPSQGASA
jgi:Protein of unknown function (DUF3180)